MTSVKEQQIAISKLQNLRKSVFLAMVISQLLIFLMRSKIFYSSLSFSRLASISSAMKVFMSAVLRWSKRLSEVLDSSNSFLLSEVASCLLFTIMSIFLNQFLLRQVIIFLNLSSAEVRRTMKLNCMALGLLISCMWFKVRCYLQCQDMRVWQRPSTRLGLVLETILEMKGAWLWQRCMSPMRRRSHSNQWYSSHLKREGVMKRSFNFLSSYSSRTRTLSSDSWLALKKPHLSLAKRPISSILVIQKVGYSVTMMAVPSIFWCKICTSLGVELKGRQASPQNCQLSSSHTQISLISWDTWVREWRLGGGRFQLEAQESSF